MSWLAPLRSAYSAVFARLEGRGFGLGLFKGVHRLVWHRLLRPDSVRVDDLTIRLPRGEDEAANTLIVRGVYEPETTAALRAIVKPGMLVADFGASFGYHTLIASRLVGAAGKVIAFEPYWLNLSHLVANLELNGCSNVFVVSAGVGSRLGAHQLSVGAQSLVMDYGTTKTQPCLVFPLDRVLEQKPNVIKMDIEGLELDALEGMSDVLTAPELTALIVECVPGNLERAGRSADELRRFLRQKGFDISVLDGRNLLCRPAATERPPYARIEYPGLQ